MTYQAIQQLIAKLSAQPDLHTSLRVADSHTVVGKFYEFQLASGFQSIIRLATREVVGYDAYARSYAADGDVISPWGLFARAADDETVVQLDRLCRLVHTINYFSQEGATAPLYLRVHGRLLAAITQDHGLAFRRMIDTLGIAPSQIVLQLPGEASQDVLLIGIIIDNYKKAGFKVGVNANTVDDALSMVHLHSPDVLKLDIRTSGDPRQQLPQLLAAARQVPTQIIFKRVENEAFATQLIQLGAEYAQGYFFGLPCASIARAQKLQA